MANIRIVLEGSAPPTGYIRLDPSEEGGSGALPAPIYFLGWLGLLRALADAVDGHDRRLSAH